MILPLLAPGERLLIYGIGNPGRQDDALGIRLVECLEAAGVPGRVTLEANYQLAPEDALLLSAHDVAIFADATVAPDAHAPYAIHRIEAHATRAFTSHALDIGTVLDLCGRLYGRAPRAFALALPAYAFEVNEDLTPRAAEHLAHAVADLVALLTRQGTDHAIRHSSRQA